jgi:galactokinase
MYAFAVPAPGSKIHIRSEELAHSTGEGDIEVDASNLPRVHEGASGYFSSVIGTLRKFVESQSVGGLNVYLRSEIPIASGMGSSGALEVAFLTLLNGAFSLGLNTRDIAEYAYFSENVGMGIPCGRLDQYSSAYGEMIVLRQRPTVSVDYLDPPDLDFVVIDSGERHKTESVHMARQSEIDQGLTILSNSSAVPRGLKSRLGRNCQATDWESVRWDEMSRYLFLLPKKSADRILFTFQMNSSTSLALSIIRRQKVDPALASNILGEDRALALSNSGWSVKETMGEIMNVQHELLRDLYEVSTPLLERIRDAVLYLSGAIGVKISGAGMGGSLVALVNDKEAGERAIREAREAGAADAWLVKKDAGCWFKGAQ